MPTEAQPDEDEGRRQAFFRQSAERAYKPQRTDYRFAGYIPRLGPAIENHDTGEAGQKGVLLRKGGVPGCIYAQVPVDRVKEKLDAGWSHSYGANDTQLPVYTIEGPNGAVDCHLLVAGTPIKGIPRESCMQGCEVHDDILERTGLANDGSLLDLATGALTRVGSTKTLDAEPDPEPPVVEAKPKPKERQKRSTRIEGPPARSS